MSLSIGIVGLPNVGKSTTFNALTKQQNAEAANYPFCTIEPNRAIVAVPDPRLRQLAELVQPEQIVPATVEFVDIAGLVRGASKGEGLGNQFLANIRETRAIVHVVRCFDDENVVHVDEQPDPARDIDTINTELVLADIEHLEKRIERLRKQARGDKKMQPLLDMAEDLNAFLESGKRAILYEPSNVDVWAELMRETFLITSKTVIYVANVDEDSLTEDNDHVRKVREIAAAEGAEVVKLCAKVEEEMAGLEDDERQEFLDELGVTESGLEQVIHQGFAAVGLMYYFTAGPKEVRAWTVRKGSTAPQAAGVIHSDIERGFIRAEVIPFEAYLEHKTETAVKAAGAMRLEGKEYIMQDGDVVHFRHNV